MIESEHSKPTRDVQISRIEGVSQAAMLAGMTMRAIELDQQLIEVGIGLKPGSLGVMFEGLSRGMLEEADAE